MKNPRKRRVVVGIAITITLAAAILGLVVRKPLLIAYHRDAMMNIWQTEMGISPRRDLIASVRDYFRVTPAPRHQNAQAATMAFSHREALLGLGFFTKRTFAIPPVSVTAQHYQQLCARTAAQTGQRPIAVFEYDSPVSPTNVIGMTVYATADDMSRWEQFAGSLATINE